MGWRLATFHRTMIPSILPDASVLPSGLKATLDTPPERPVKGGPTGWRVAAFHKMIVPSSLPEAKVLPSGLKTTLLTKSECPVKGWPMAGGWPIPQVDSLVTITGGQCLAVRAEDHAIHTAEVTQ